MTDFTIRKATIEDLPAVLSLYGQPDIDDGRVLDLVKAQAIFQLMSSYPSYQLFVASSGDQIVGTYTLIILCDEIRAYGPLFLAVKAASNQLRGSVPPV